MEDKLFCDNDLLHFLQNLIKNNYAEDIDYLVDILTDKGKGRLALSSSVKDLLLNEKEDGDYTENGLRYLLHELQLYGGNSIMNRSRKEPLHYNKLLTNVHAKLKGIDTKKKSNSQKEKEIVLSIFGKDWQKLSAAERMDRSTAVGRMSDSFNMQDHLAKNKDGSQKALPEEIMAVLFSTIKNSTTSPASSLKLVFTIPTEAHRILIPFIAHIARLKMMHSFS